MNGEKADFCPGCFASGPNLRFKVSSKCYHRICEGCLDRIFSGGKAECPLAYCHQESWKRDWRTQTFEDLQIEREVDIRKRVMAILNRREEEFETKLDWDNFLELREEMIMNLALGTNVTATNKKLKDYEQANAISIKQNAALERREAELSAGANLDFFSTSNHDYAISSTDTSGLVKGLRKISAPIPKRAYDPFMGMSTKRDYYTVREEYPLHRLSKAKTDSKTLAGGFDFQQFYDEALLRAFAGLGCFIEEEKRAQQSSGKPLSAGTSDDVF